MSSCSEHTYVSEHTCIHDKTVEIDILYYTVLYHP
jgi:hypothetical protein